MKKNFVAALIMTQSAVALAEIPKPIVEFVDVYQTHATVAGRLNSKPTAPMGVTVENGGVKYSTLTDADGYWGIVFKYRSPRYLVRVFGLTDNANKSQELRGNLVSRTN
jgi:hypothetical protein